MALIKDKFAIKRAYFSRVSLEKKKITKLSFRLILNHKYITNDQKVFEILNNYDFNLQQIDTTNMYNYILTIGKPDSNVNTCFFNYREGLGHDTLTLSNKEDKILNAFWCLLSDYQCYKESVDAWDFCDIFGYEQTKENHKIYYACEDTANKLEKLFTQSDLDFLLEDINL